jgi:hypothetical protein
MNQWERFQRCHSNPAENFINSLPLLRKKGYQNRVLTFCRNPNCAVNIVMILNEEKQFAPWTGYKGVKKGSNTIRVPCQNGAGGLSESCVAWEEDGDV